MTAAPLLKSVEIFSSTNVQIGLFVCNCKVPERPGIEFAAACRRLKPNRNTCIAGHLVQPRLSRTDNLAHVIAPARHPVTITMALSLSTVCSLRPAVASAPRQRVAAPSASPLSAPLRPAAPGKFRVDQLRSVRNN